VNEQIGGFPVLTAAEFKTIVALGCKK